MLDKNIHSKGRKNKHQPHTAHKEIVQSTFVVNDIIDKKKFIIALCLLLLLGGASLIMVSNFLWQQNFDPVLSRQTVPIKIPSKTLIDNCKIFMPSHYIEEFRVRGLSAWFPLIEKQIKNIRVALPRSFNGERLNRLLEKNIFEIEIVPENDRRLIGKQKRTPYSRFLPSADIANEKHKILIKQDSDFTIDELVSILANELHHLSTITATLERIGKSDTLVSSKHKILPFLTHDWAIDNNLRKEHKESIQAAFKEIDKFRSLFNAKKASHNLSTENRKLFNDYMKAFHDYQPRELHQSLPTLYYYYALQIAEKLPDGKIKLILEGIPLYIHSSIITEEEAVIHYTYAASNKTIDKAATFLKEIDAAKKQVYEGPYKDVSNEDEQDMEFSSFIEEFPSSIKEIFFSKWCEYFSRYIDQVNYCSK